MTTQTDIDPDTKVGLGFRICYRGSKQYAEHSGSQEKTRTRLRYYLDDGLCIVAMSNSEHTNSYDIVRGIEDVVRAVN